MKDTNRRTHCPPLGVILNDVIRRSPRIGRTQTFWPLRHTFDGQHLTIRSMQIFTSHRYKGPGYPGCRYLCKLKQTYPAIKALLNYLKIKSHTSAFGISTIILLKMPQNNRLSRYDHLKALFSRNSSQEPEIKDDTTSEITLVPRYAGPNYAKK